ncbi:thiamine pyrophosphate-binding protein [Nocardia miyunensis]|uniref:thiamine pyrophosphate-binding protein n=1 Tax=Nocardia miyunensis TaxID=282684 RepID=UPI000836F60D|nr:thiamine pyrophosphate-binding protein [Nocardia miyunensis]
MTTNGGELVARTLAAAGVRHAFGIHGGHLDAMLVEMVRLGITLVDTRHEAAAGNAAEGYARVTGGLGVAFATAGPGFTNILAAIANAHADRIPLLVLTSSPPLRESELNVLQGAIDQIAAATPITRFAHRVTTASRVPDLVALAIRHATCGVPGPVVLELPIDIMFRPVADEAVSVASLHTPEPPSPSVHAIDRTVELLAAAQRPVIVLGGGAASSPGMTEELTRFLDRTSIPVIAASWSPGTLPPEHPCLLGGPGELIALPLLVEAPDLVLVIGKRRGVEMGGRTTSSIPASATVVQVDVDGIEPGRVGSVDLAVRSDATEFVRRLSAAKIAGDWSEWNMRAKAARGAHELVYADAEPITVSGRIHPWIAAREVTGALDVESVGIFDGGEVACWVSMFATGHRAGSWFGLGAMGGLGVGPGMAIGAATARPGARVVLMSGDGAIGFHIQELDTMVRHHLPITVVVFNNMGWGMSLHGQQSLYGEATRVLVDLPDTRYDRIAESFGLYGERIDKPEEIGAALRRARATGGPALLDLAIAPEIVHPVMQQMLQQVPEGHTQVPYYETIPPGEA